MNYLYDLPDGSWRYLKVSMIRTAIIFFLLFGFLKITKIWDGFEDKLILLGGLSIIYHYVVFFIKRRKEKKSSKNDNDY